MSGRDMERIIERLVSFGYIGHNEGDKSDMVASYMFSGGSNIKAWLD